jgi:fibro-slime domain-containing protein
LQNVSFLYTPKTININSHKNQKVKLWPDICRLLAEAAASLVPSITNYKDLFMNNIVKAIIGSSLVLISGASFAAILTLEATVRDFQQEHPDFQNGASGLVQGLVADTLGPDGKPVYVGGTSLSSEENFNQWYNDVQGVNQSFQISLVATETFAGSGIFEYTNNAYFPINGQGFGNQGNANNYHFTTEINTLFTYAEGQTFEFSGDDDVWVFINGQLVVDIGGVHPELSDSIDLDTLGLTIGDDYTLDIFHAERQTVGSNFNFTTSARLRSVDVSTPSAFALMLFGVFGLALTARKR